MKMEDGEEQDLKSSKDCSNLSLIAIKNSLVTLLPD
jgi:hypothetical protein